MVNQTTGANQISQTHKVLTMVKNERMGGMVPVWKAMPITKNQDIEQNLTSAASMKPDNSFENILAYQSNQSSQITKEPEEFGFADIIDMVNPLQHIPVVSSIYQNITGDTIKPIGRIVGGAIFAGPLGAASGLINVIIEEETGKDITGNAIAMAFKGERPSLKAAPSKSAHPEATLNKIAKQTNTNDLPASLLAFTDNGNENIHIEKRPVSGGRTAGTMNYKTYPGLASEMLLSHDPITEIILRPMPKRY